MNLQEDIRLIVSEISGLPEGADPRADLYLDLGVASIHALQLLAELEDRFSVAIPDDQFVQATSIEKLAHVVEELRR